MMSQLIASWDSDSKILDNDSRPVFYAKYHKNIIGKIKWTENSHCNISVKICTEKDVGADLTFLGFSEQHSMQRRIQNPVERLRWSFL